jgi:hypothetical protein
MTRSGPSGMSHREQRSEISIRGHDDSMLGGSALEDHSAT